MRGESGESSFAEWGMKCIVDWLLRIVMKRAWYLILEERG